LQAQSFTNGKITGRSQAMMLQPDGRISEEAKAGINVVGSKSPDI